MSKRDDVLAKICKHRGMLMSTVIVGDETIKAPYIKEEGRPYNPYDNWADAGVLLEEISMAAASTSQVVIDYKDSGRVNVRFSLADGRVVNEFGDSVTQAVCAAWVAWRERPGSYYHPVFIPGV